MSPIVGFSDQNRWTRGGHIRLGVKNKTQSGAEYPVKTDYFVFDPFDSSLMDIWDALYGTPGEPTKATKITVALPSNDYDEVYNEYYRCYGTNGLLCKGTGQEAQRSDEKGGMFSVECPEPENCDYALKRGRKEKNSDYVVPGCKRVGRLSVYLPDMPTLQVFELATSGRNSCLNIHSGLRQLFSVKHGKPAGVPFELHLNPQQTQHPRTGQKVLIYAVTVVIPASLRDIGAVQSLLDINNLPALPAPDESCPTDLYPRGTVKQLEGPGTTTVTVENDQQVEVETATGRVLNEDAEDPDIPFDDDDISIPPPPPPPPPARTSGRQAAASRPAAQQPPAAQPAVSANDLSADPEIIEALKGFTAAKRNGLLDSAKAGAWSKKELLEVVAQQKRPTGSLY